MKATENVNPVLREMLADYEPSTLEEMRDSLHYWKNILRALGADLGIIGFPREDVCDVDRDNSSYERLAEAMHALGTAGDLVDAIEAIDFALAILEK